MTQITREEMIELLSRVEAAMEFPYQDPMILQNVRKAKAALQAAEPVAYCKPEDAWHFQNGALVEVCGQATAEHVVPLFTLPCPPAKAHVPDALREIAGWMEDGGPTWHEAEMIGMEISGAVGVSSAKRCTEAARRAFLEAARIWEYMHRDEMLAASPAPDHSDDGNEMVEILKWIASGETAKGCYDGSDEVGVIKERVTSFLARHHRQGDAER